MRRSRWKRSGEIRLAPLAVDRSSRGWDSAHRRLQLQPGSWYSRQPGTAAVWALAWVLAVLLLAMPNLSAQRVPVANGPALLLGKLQKEGGTIPVAVASEPTLPVEVAHATSPISANETPGWTQIVTTTHPSARDEPGIAYDPADGYVILLGGSAGEVRRG